MRVSGAAGALRDRERGGEEQRQERHPIDAPIGYRVILVLPLNSRRPREAVRTPRGASYSDALAGGRAISASSSARNSAVTSGVLPNHSAKPRTAWCSSMPSPSAVQVRAPRAAQQRRHQRHINEFGDNGVTGQPPNVDIEAGCPVMPSVVVLTRSAVSASAALRSSQRDRVARARPNRSRNAAARSGVRLTTAIAFDAALQQAVDDGAGRAAGAEHDGFAQAAAPARARKHRDCPRKPSTSVLVERSTAVEPQRIGGADGAGAIVGLRAARAPLPCAAR